MSSVTEVCQSIVESVDDCLAVGVVDLGTGMMMGVHHTVPHFTQAYLDAVAAAAVELFRGKNVRRVEELLGEQRGEDITNSFEEVFVSTKKTFHFMGTIPEKGAVVVMVTKKSTSQGMGWAALRNGLNNVAASLP